MQLISLGRLHLYFYLTSEEYAHGFSISLFLNKHRCNDVREGKEGHAETGSHVFEVKISMAKAFFFLFDA